MQKNAKALTSPAAPEKPEPKKVESEKYLGFRQKKKTTAKGGGGRGGNNEG